MIGSFIAICLISAAVIFTTWLITYEVLRIVWAWLPRFTIAPRLRVLLIGVPIFAVHIMGIWIYAIMYFLLENYTGFGHIIGQGRNVGVSLESFLDCLHFSSVTYTSLGLGDFVPIGNLRMLAGAEVLNGLLMIGWTISFTFLTMEKFWQLPHRRDRK